MDIVAGPSTAATVAASVASGAATPASGAGTPAFVVASGAGTPAFGAAACIAATGRGVFTSLGRGSDR